MSYTGTLLFSAQVIAGFSSLTGALSRKKHPNKGVMRRGWLRFASYKKAVEIGINSGLSKKQNMLANQNRKQNNFSMHRTSIGSFWQKATKS
jgi:hypothetical protein